MKSIFLILLIACLTKSGFAVPAKFICEYWTIEIKLPNGKSADVLVSASREQSFLDARLVDDDFSSQFISIQIGNVKLPSTEFSIGSMNGDFQDNRGSIAGFIGRDILKHLALGLDTSKKTWKVWSAGGVDSVALQQFFGAGNKHEKISMSYSRIQEPYIDIRFGDSPRKMLVDPSASWSFLKPKFLANLDTIHIRSQKLQASLRSEMSLVFGPFMHRLPFLLLGNRATEHISEEIDGMVSSADLLFEKYVFDYSGRAMYLDVADKTKLGSRSLSRLIGIPLAIEVSKLTVGEWDRFPVSDGFKPFLGAQVTSIGDIELSEIDAIVEQLQGKGSLSLSLFKRIGLETSSTFTLGLLKDGVSQNVSIQRRGG